MVSFSVLRDFFADRYIDVCYLFLWYIQIALEADGLAVLHIHEYRRRAITENVYVETEPVFRTPRSELDFGSSLLVPLYLIIIDWSFEVQPFATTIRNGVGTSVVGEVGYDGVIPYFYRIGGSE